MFNCNDKYCTTIVWASPIWYEVNPLITKEHFPVKLTVPCPGSPSVVQQVGLCCHDEVVVGIPLSMLLTCWGVTPTAVCSFKCTAPVGCHNKPPTSEYERLCAMSDPHTVPEVETLFLWNHLFSHLPIHDLYLYNLLTVFHSLWEENYCHQTSGRDREGEGGEREREMCLVEQCQTVTHTENSFLCIYLLSNIQSLFSLLSIWQC